MGGKRKGRTAPAAVHPLAGIGHNGGPDAEAMQLFELIGPRPTVAIPAFECGAPWTAYATEAELKRLGTLQARITRREKALSEMKAERTRIMNRNIRRMRRAKGKQ